MALPRKTSAREGESERAGSDERVDPTSIDVHGHFLVALRERKCWP